MGKGEQTRPGWSVPGVGHYSVDLLAEATLLTRRFTDEAAGAPVSEQLKRMRMLIDQLEAAWLGAAGDFDQAGGPLDDGAPSLAAWLRHVCRMAPAEANSRARVADAITAGSLQTSGSAMKSGEVSWRHVAVIEATMRDVPEQQHSAVELAMQEPAKQLDPMLLRRVGAEVLHQLDVERAEAAAVRRLERRGIDVAETFDGMVAVHGLLDPIAGAALLTALDSKVRPTRGDQQDTRTWPQRRADALSDICREWLDLGETPQVGGQRPHVAVRVDLETLRKDLGCDAALLEWAGPITAEQARMLACDASVSRIVTDGPSEILDVGRATRTIPPGIRRAVVARDLLCVATGCHRPAHQCDVHHIVFWADGGPTSLDNLVLLCRRHHGFVHGRGWQVVENDDGSRTLIPPRCNPPPRL